jgi:hypothetical protein
MSAAIGLGLNERALSADANAIGAADAIATAGSTASAGKRRSTVSAGDMSTMAAARAGATFGRAANPAASPPSAAAPMTATQANTQLPVP